MENIILISKSWEKAEIGYVSTFIKINRATNALISVSYIWYEEFRVNSTNKNFDSFESLNTFINELVDAKMEQYEMEMEVGITDIETGIL